MKLCRAFISFADFVILWQILCFKSQLTEAHGDADHHEESKDKRHLLGHLGEWLDLDGLALRHIEDHLQTLIDSRDDIKDIADGDNSKGLFFFFKIHDYDNNDKLDGLEWFKALTDFHEVSHKHGGEDYADSEVETMIDDLLKKHDTDQDGYISFTEMINSKPDSLFNELDKMDEENVEPQHDVEAAVSENENDEENQQNLHDEQENEKFIDSPDQNDENAEQHHQADSDIRIIDSEEGENQRLVDSQENSPEENNEQEHEKEF